LLAKSKYENKVKKLEDLKSNFTDNDNKNQIGKIVTELRDENKIKNISQEQTDQEGNRYIIAARMAE
jgi:glutamate formiminotransferase